MPIPVVGGIAAAIATWTARVFATKAGPIIAGALAWAGLGLASYEFAIEPLFGTLSGAWGGLPADIMAILGRAKIDVGITIVLSAIAARWSIGSAIRMVRR